MKATRREFLRLSALAGATLATGTVPGIGAARETGPGGADSVALDLSISGYEYDHVRALIDGRVEVQGCNLRFQLGKIGDVKPRSFPVREPWT